MTWNEEILQGEKDDLKVTIDRLRDRIEELKKSQLNAEIELSKAEESIKWHKAKLKEKAKELEKAIDKLNELNN